MAEASVLYAENETACGSCTWQWSSVGTGIRIGLRVGLGLLCIGGGKEIRLGACMVVEWQSRKGAQVRRCFPAGAVNTVHF